MRSRPIMVVVASVMLLASAVAACGSDQSGSTSRSASDDTPESVVASTAAIGPEPTAAAPTTVATTVATIVPESTTSPEPATSPLPVFDFTSTSAADGWSVVNDTVMGGVSSGQLEVVGGALVFTGELSLDNNGGFASVRSPLIEPERAAEWATRDGVRVQAQGDGRTWTVEMRTDEVDGGWIAELPTSADSPTDATLTWSSFEPVTRFLDPRPSAGPLEPARIMSIAFYLVDGIEAPFRLGLRSIS